MKSLTSSFALFSASASASTSYSYSCSSPDSTASSQSKHEVFLSFRGEDTRDTFTSHLYEALQSQNIPTFMDNKLATGEEIKPSLLKAIEDSKISIVILSQNYSSSKWCLEELVKILDCKKNNGQIVIPVFYQISPSDVGNQTGSFGDAFLKHKEFLTVDKEKVQSWRVALNEVANLAGHSDVIRPESELIKAIVKDTWDKLNRKPSSEIESQIQKFLSLATKQSQKFTLPDEDQHLSPLSEKECQKATSTLQSHDGFCSKEVPAASNNYAKTAKCKIHYESSSDDRESGDEPAERVSAKSKLLEICTAYNWKPPLFELWKEEGPCHMRLFTFKVEVEIEDAECPALESYGSPRPKKKAAEEHAAEGALWFLKSLGYFPIIEGKKRKNKN